MKIKVIRTYAENVFTEQKKNELEMIQALISSAPDQTSHSCGIFILTIYPMRALRQTVKLFLAHLENEPDRELTIEELFYFTVRLLELRNRYIKTNPLGFEEEIMNALNLNMRKYAKVLHLYQQNELNYETLGTIYEIPLTQLESDMIEPNVTRSGKRFR